jgi:MFS family permease
MLFLLFAGYAESVWMLYAFVVFYGIGSGAMGPVPTAAVGDLFPGKDLGRIFGVLTIAFGTGGALGPYIGGYIFDRTGSYTLPFLMAVVGICVGGAAIWIAAPRRR